MVNVFIAKIATLMLLCTALSGCFVNHLLNYPFRSKEVIASLPIDPDSRDVQAFVLDGIRTDARFYLHDSLGPYNIDICKDDTVDSYNSHVKILVTLSAGGMEPRTKLRTKLFYTGVGCDGINGWNVASFLLPKDFDLDQKVTLTLQILEDKDDFFKTLTNPKLVFWAGKGTLK